MLKKRKKIIIISAIVFVLLAVVYFVFVSPLLSTEEAEETPELLPGEVLGTNNRILLFEHIEQESVKEIEVHNSYGSYCFYKSDDDDSFYIKDMESAPFSKSKLSSLVVAAGYTLSMERVTTDCEDLSEYGLDEASNPAWYTITSTEGAQYKVYIGSAIPTGAGYYARCDGRNAVYILSSDLKSTLLSSINDFIEPILTLNTSSDDYFTVTDFYIFNYDDCKLWIDYVDGGVDTTLPTSTCYIMKAPANYNPSTAYEQMLTTFEWFTGTEVVAIDSIDRPLSDDVLLSYGIDPDRPAWTIHYTYKDFESMVFLSEKFDEGYYYAYSLVFNMIAKVDADTVYFLDWELIDIVDEDLYMLNIDDISTIEISSDKINETFTIDGEGTDLKVVPQSLGTAFDSTDLQNFRQFYKTILGVKLQGYADDTSKNNLILSLKITTDAKVVYEYKFYQYASRRCYYTVNGKGDFYVLYDSVEKVISDAIKAVNGETIDSWAKN